MRFPRYYPLFQEDFTDTSQLLSSSFEMRKNRRDVIDFFSLSFAKTKNSLLMSSPSDSNCKSSFAPQKKLQSQKLFYGLNPARVPL
jgi:hypothetical protein